MITSNDLIILCILIFILLETIALIIYLKMEHAPIRTNVVQWTGIVLFIPFVFLLAYIGKIDGNTVSTLLGAFAGYVFGKTSLTEEWTESK